MGLQSGMSVAEKRVGNIGTKKQHCGRAGGRHRWLQPWSSCMNQASAFQRRQLPMAVCRIQQPSRAIGRM